MQKYKKFCEGKKIRWASVYKHNMDAINTIQFSFDGYNDHLDLDAIGDCCSSSWFYFFDDTGVHLAKNTIESFAKEKTILSIEFLHKIQLPISNIQEYDINHLVRINFTDGSNYEFVLRNSSNGYYDGWIEINIGSSLHPDDFYPNKD